MTTTTLPTTSEAPAATQVAPARTLGIAAMVLGIASIVSGFNPVLGATGLVLGIVGLRTETASRNFSITGIVTGAVSLVGIGFGILGFALFLPFLPLIGFAGGF